MSWSIATGAIPGVDVSAFGLSDETETAIVRTLEIVQSPTHPGVVDRAHFGRFFATLGIDSTDAVLADLLEQCVGNDQTAPAQQLVEIYVLWLARARLPLRSKVDDISRWAAVSFPVLLPDAAWRVLFHTFFASVCATHWALVWFRTALDGFDRPAMAAYVTVDLLFSIVYAIDMACWFFTARISQGGLETSLPTIRHQYLRSWEFIVGVIGTVPLDVICSLAGWGVASGVFSFLRLVHPFRIHRYWKVSHAAPMTSWYVQFFFAMLPLMSLVFLMFLASHVLACGWVWLRVWTGSSRIDYWKSYYFVVYTFSTVGYGDVEIEGVVQTWLAVILVAAGLFASSVIVGRLVVLIQLGDARVKRQDQLRETLAVLGYFEVPKALQTEILSFQEHVLWSDPNEAFTKELESLPNTVKDAINIQARVDLLRSVPPFEFSSEEVVLDLAQSLISRTYRPESHITFVGDPHHGLQFLLFGYIARYDVDAKFVTILRTGEFFGHEDRTILAANPFEAFSHNTLSYCDIMVLSLQTLQRASVRYANFGADFEAALRGAPRVPGQGQGQGQGQGTGSFGGDPKNVEHSPPPTLLRPQNSQSSPRLRRGLSSQSGGASSGGTGEKADRPVESRNMSNSDNRRLDSLSGHRGDGHLLHVRSAVSIDPDEGSMRPGSSGNVLSSPGPGGSVLVLNPTAFPQDSGLSTGGFSIGSGRGRVSSNAGQARTASPSPSWVARGRRSQPGSLAAGRGSGSPIGRRSLSGDPKPRSPMADLRELEVRANSRGDMPGKTDGQSSSPKVSMLVFPTDIAAEAHSVGGASGGVSPTAVSPNAILSPQNTSLPGQGTTSGAVVAAAAAAVGVGAVPGRSQGSRGGGPLSAPQSRSSSGDSRASVTHTASRRSFEAQGTVVVDTTMHPLPATPLTRRPTTEEFEEAQVSPRANGHAAATGGATGGSKPMPRNSLANGSPPPQSGSRSDEQQKTASPGPALGDPTNGAVSASAPPPIAALPASGPATSTLTGTVPTHSGSGATGTTPSHTVSEMGSQRADFAGHAFRAAGRRDSRSFSRGASGASAHRQQPIPLISRISGGTVTSIGGPASVGQEGAGGRAGGGGLGAAWRSGGYGGSGRAAMRGRIGPEELTDLRQLYLWLKKTNRHLKASLGSGAKSNEA